MSLDITELEPTHRTDFKRVNGAPQIVDREGKAQRYSRPSSFAKPLDDESALVNWRIDRAAIGVAYDRALQAAYVAVDQEDREGLRNLREKAIAAGRGAERADIGTALHAMSCRWEQGEAGFLPPEPYITSLMAYTRELKRLGLETLRYEWHVVNTEYRCAGTADRLYETTVPLLMPDGMIMPVGTLVVGDLKTGDKLEYSKAAYAVQLALYAGGEMYDVVADEFIATPPINQQWAIIVHMPADEPGRCEFLWVDLDVGRFGAYLVQQIKLWRKNWRSGEYELPHLMVQSDLVQAFDDGPSTIDDVPVDGVSTIPPTDDGGDTDDIESWVEWIRLRLSYISKNPDAKRDLLLRWPEGLPTPKQGIDNMREVGMIIDLLNKIEADHQLGFVEKPAALMSKGPQPMKGRK